AIALQVDGKMVIGGFFTEVAGQPRNRIARLNADGSLDTTYNADANSWVNTVAVQPDGKLVLGGNFTTLAGQPRNRIARLNADGSLDTAFNPDANGLVFALAVQLEGKMVVGGSFTMIGGQPRNYIARLNANGSLDNAFNPGSNNQVTALALQPDGKLVVGGDFSALGGQTRNSIARLSTAQAALQSLEISGTTVTWTRSGAGPDLALPPTLLFSLSGVLYSPVGSMQRISGGWRLTNFTPPPNQIFYLRTRAQVSSGQYNGSSGLIESTRQFFIGPPLDGIFANGFE
ncbi:MAG: delta-60 repeat domain-containing protein, partial [Dokdonella sp.]